MDSKVTHIVKLLSMSLSLLSLAACSDESYNGTDGTELVTLTLKTRAVDAGTQNDESAESTIHSLRTVILSKKATENSWKVEHNDFLSYGGILIIGNERDFEVEENSTKKIYFIANEEQVKANVESGIVWSDNRLYIPETNGIAPVDKITTFLMQDESILSEGMPMTSVYDVEIGEQPKKMNCYVVRTTNKLSLSYTNETEQVPANPGTGGSIFARRRTIRLLGWTLESIADQTYLMPHVNKNQEDKYWVVNTERKTPESLGGTHWIDWMRTETEKESQPYQWLTDYEIPTEATHAVYTYWSDRNKAPVIVPKDGVNNIDGNFPISYQAPVIYLAESRNREYYGPEHGSTPADSSTPEDTYKNLMLQQYRLTIITNELDENLENKPENWKAASYTAILPQLASLFRNTHVKVNITFKGAGQLALFAEIAPWGAIDSGWGELQPATTSYR